MPFVSLRPTLHCFSVYKGLSSGALNWNLYLNIEQLNNVRVPLEAKKERKNAQKTSLVLATDLSSSWCCRTYFLTLSKSSLTTAKWSLLNLSLGSMLSLYLQFETVVSSSPAQSAKIERYVVTWVFERSIKDMVIIIFSNILPIKIRYLIKILGGNLLKYIYCYLTDRRRAV